MRQMFAISRIEKYKYSDCGGVWKDVLRTAPNYKNPNIDLSKSHLNKHLVGTNIANIEKFILEYRKKHNIKGRFNTVAKNPKNLTNVMCQALFTCSNEYINSLSYEQQIAFFQRCLEFFKVEFPDVPILSAVIHYDQSTPHMHLTFLPIVIRVSESTGKREKIFSTSLLMPGKDFYPKYQDRFFSFISTKYDGLSRNISQRKNLNPEEYRKVAPILKEYETLRRENKQLKQENAALLKSMAGLKICSECKHNDFCTSTDGFCKGYATTGCCKSVDCPCMNCVNEGHWEWRGIDNVTAVLQEHDSHEKKGN